MSDSKSEANDDPLEGETSDAGGAATRTSGKRRKRRKKRPNKRPVFARSYPSDPEVDRLLQAFEAGNYGLVRTDATALADRTEDEAVRDAALDLRRRIEPTPTSVYLWAIGVGLVVFLFGYYLMQSH
jgi:hypothetical protein